MRPVSEYKFAFSHLAPLHSTRDSCLVQRVLFLMLCLKLEAEDASVDLKSNEESVG